MQRHIYEVYAKVVDANGTYNTLSGYPKAFDSRLYNHDLDKTIRRAYAEYFSTLGTMYSRDDRQLQLVILIDVNNGLIIERQTVGILADIEEPSEG